MQRTLIRLCFAAGLAAGAWPVAAQSPSRPDHAPLRVLAAGADGSVTSPNWSGYALGMPEGTVTQVAGSWVVPQANCGGGSPATAGASHWIGIDGYYSKTVEQTGTDTDCDHGVPTYYAWYEFYPHPGITIHSLTVHAGDVMQASVRYHDGQFTVDIADVSSGQTFTVSAAVPGARRNSAEWIAEANSNQFTNFGTALFGDDQTGVPHTCSATLEGGEDLALGAFPSSTVHAITMVDAAGITLARPGALSADGSSFAVQWLAAR